MSADLAYRTALIDLAIHGEKPWPRPSRLRILTAIHSFEPGGVERVALRLHAAWQAMGVDSRMVVGHGGGAGASLAQGLDCRVITEDAESIGTNPLFHMIRHLPQIIREQQPDVLFCPGNTYSSVGAAMKLALGRACPPIVNKVSNDYRRLDLNPIARFGYHFWLRIPGLLIDRFVAMSPPMTDEIERLAGVPRSRIAVINDPVLRHDEVAHFSALQHLPGSAGRRFLAIGRLMPQKNFPLLLSAFAAGAGPDDRLTILGEGPLRSTLAEQATALGIDDRLDMPGHVDDVLPWLARTDIFIMSSDYEGVPAALIEAIAARLSVIATNCSAAMSTLTGHGQFGTLVPVGDARALAAAISAARPWSPDDLPGDAVKAHVEQFTVEAGARGYLALMAALVAGKERSRRPAFA